MRGVGAQQRLQHVAGERGGEGGVAVQAESVDQALGDAGVRGVDVVGGQIAGLDVLPEAGETVDLAQGLRLGAGEPVAEGLTHLLDLRVHGRLRLAVPRGGRLLAAAGGLVPYGEQDRLLVLVLHLVDEGGHLHAVPYELCRVRRVAGLPHLVGDEVRQQQRDHRERDADEGVELAPERPPVGESTDTARRRRWRCRRGGGRVHHVRGHRASLWASSRRAGFTKPLFGC